MCSYVDASIHANHHEMVTRFPHESSPHMCGHGSLGRWSAIDVVQLFVEAQPMAVLSDVMVVPPSGQLFARELLGRTCGRT